VTLPAKKYSVLDSDSVQKLGGNRFRVSGGKQSLMFGQKGEPVGVRLAGTAPGTGPDCF
jgi:hypothetical protein